MYKKITGVDEENCRVNMAHSVSDFKSYVSQLSASKDLDAQRRHENDQERARIRKEQKDAAMFKFGKMTKAKPFFPTLNTKGYLQKEPMTSFEKGLPYTEGREKESLLFPTRAKDYSKLFGLQKTCDGNFFSKPVGREIDQFDEVMQKYLTSTDRGLVAPKKGDTWGYSTHVPKSTAYLEGTNGVFRSTDTYMNLFNRTKPLLDRSNTPRKATKSITLDRNFTKQRWLYNKNTSDEFDMRLTKIDVKRGKVLKRITRREDKERARSRSAKSK
jgi:hypothetical protein